MSPEWLIAAVIIAVASFVLGFAGFGNGLVAMALLPFVMSPVTAIVVLTIYTIVLVLVILLPVWHCNAVRSMAAVSELLSMFAAVFSVPARPGHGLAVTPSTWSMGK